MRIDDDDILSASILIVDDQEANVKQLSRLLGEAGYRHVAATTDPAEVGAVHRCNAYDLILLDLQMRGMDGFAVMDRLKSSVRASRLPVIALTAQPDHKLSALQAGARDYISKPFDLLEVKTRIRNMLEVRLLYRRLEDHNQSLELAVQQRTAELRDSEARFRSLTELASDWYWEQDEHGVFTKVSGPVLEMLGLRTGRPDGDGDKADPAGDDGWVEAERQALQASIAARRPFLDFVFHRRAAGGATRAFRVSGQPMFDRTCRLVGYRGIGAEVVPAR